VQHFEQVPTRLPAPSERDGMLTLARRLRNWELCQIQPTQLCHEPHPGLQGKRIEHATFNLAGPERKRSLAGRSASNKTALTSSKGSLQCAHVRKGE